MKDDLNNNCMTGAGLQSCMLAVSLFYDQTGWGGRGGHSLQDTSLRIDE